MDGPVTLGVTSKQAVGPGHGLLRKMGDHARTFRGALIRRKEVGADAESSHLKRCLSTFDLTLLGVGGTLGLGIYVLAGQVASTKAGPAVVLSFLIAGVASIFSALCYAELGARVPRAGSAYVYSYVTVGEFMAFIIGWNLILEYVIGNASVARGYSGYLDSLLNHTIEQHMKEWMPIGVPGLSSYPDVFALGITLFLAGMVAIGVKESTRFNTIFTCLNLAVVLFVVIAGSFKADIANWRLKPQDVGWPVAMWIVSIGALAGLSTSLLGGMFALPRVLYAMGSDGLIFRFLATVHPRLKTPLIGTAVAGIFSGVMAMMFNVEELANMMSIGTLLAYSLVAVSVLMLRYDVPEEQLPKSDVDESRAKQRPQGPRGLSTMLFNLDHLSIPTDATAFIVTNFILAVGVLFLGLTALLVFAEEKVLTLAASIVGPIALLVVLSLFCIVCIIRQPSAATDNLSFVVPLVPFIPLFNIFINLYLMMRLPLATWARFGIWMAAGMLIYFGYGIWHSSQRKPSPPISDGMAGKSTSSSNDATAGTPTSPKQ